jgi:glycerol-3-phosphate acyltransferase PlsY
VERVAVYSGLSIVGAYLLGSIPFGYLLTRRRFRRDLAGDDLVAMLTGSTSGAHRPDAAIAAALDTAKVLLAATFAWHLVLTVAPGNHGVNRGMFSAVGFLSDQVLLAWQSVGLWAGLAALVGHLAPPWFGFRSNGAGLAPGLGLLAVYAPFALAGGALGYLVMSVARVPVRLRVGVGLACMISAPWSAWVVGGTSSYGLPQGPELALWCTVLAGVVATRLLPPSTASPPRPPL